MDPNADEGNALIEQNSLILLKQKVLHAEEETKDQETKDQETRKN